MRGASPRGEGLANHPYRVLRVRRLWRRRKEDNNISSLNETCEAYTGNSLLAAGSIARSQSNSAPKRVLAVATLLTQLEANIGGIEKARCRRTAGVQERGTEKETRSGTSETHDLPWSTGVGQFNKKENCPMKSLGVRSPIVLRDGNAVHTGKEATSRHIPHRKHAPERRSGKSVPTSLGRYLAKQVTAWLSADRVGSPVRENCTPGSKGGQAGQPAVLPHGRPGKTK